MPSSLSKELKYLIKVKAAMRAGDSVARMNLAVAYRDLDNYRRAFFWWNKLANEGEGDAALDVGYCYQYGIGVRRNQLAAEAAYKKAIKSIQPCTISQWDREEAMYHYAVLLLDRGTDEPRYKQRAIALLNRANEDDDYPAASILLKQLKQNKALTICSCRRERWRNSKGQARCELHRRKAGYYPIRQSS
jgi:TPR repeat protein